jgi:hypothetical protein
MYPLDRRLGGSQNWSGRGDEQKNFQPLPGLEHPIIQPVAQRYTTELSWFFCDSVLLSFETHWLSVHLIVETSVQMSALS